MTRNSIFFTLLPVLIFTVLTCQGNLTVFNLTCENLSNPLGINSNTPRFSWKIRSHKNGTEQKAFQLLVASDPSLLKSGQADLWDSGKQLSLPGILVPYQGKELGSGSVAYWKIRIWDQEGNVSHWSPVASFTIGLLKREDWQARYIGYPTEAGYNECPRLSKSFLSEKSPGKLLLYVNSLGYHEVYVNGVKVGDGVLSPAVSQFDKRSQVITYDISSLVKKGKNQLVLWLGAGWYRDGLPGVTHKGPVVKAQLEMVSGKKREVLVVTDKTWLGRKSGYSRLSSGNKHHLGGEIVDGSLAKQDLASEETPELTWSPVREISVPDHEATPQMTELNRITETIAPKEIKSLSKDTVLVDMGRTLTGWTEIHFPKLRKSQEIVLEYSDHLDEDGKFSDQRQTDRYIASGNGNEVFINKFNYHGYRYIRISNLNEIPSGKSIKAYLIHTGYEPASGFQCSDPDLNKIHDMVQYTLKCLSIGGDLVDCPQIERLGYGGDGNASTATAQTMFNLDPLYANWLQAWADCIREDGGMPHTAPNPFAAGGGPYWCGFIITASWSTYLNYGDSLLLRKYYPAMQKWLAYVDKYSVNGLLKPWPENDYRGWYLGDWATPTGIDQKAEASVNLVNNCFLAVCLDRMQKIANVLGKPGEAELYLQKEEKLRQKIHQTYFDPAKNSYGTGTQIDLAYPMLAGVVPSSLTGAVTKTLVDEIRINRDGHLATGLVGVPVITEWAVRNKACDLMYDMLKKRGYPGYMYMIDNGATTTWEHWNGERSRIHNCYNGIGSWFYQAVGGLVPEENTAAYRKVLIQPQIPHGVTWAKSYKETPFGTIFVNWSLKGGNMLMELEIPVGVDAGVVIPSGIKKYRLGENDHDLSGEKEAVVPLKSGKYKIRYTSKDDIY